MAAPTIILIAFVCPGLYLFLHFFDFLSNIFVSFQNR